MTKFKRYQLAYQRGLRHGYNHEKEGIMNPQKATEWRDRGRQQNFTIEESPESGSVIGERTGVVEQKIESEYREGYLLGVELSKEGIVTKDKLVHYRSATSADGPLPNIGVKELRQALINPSQAFKAEGFTKDEETRAEDGTLKSNQYKNISYRKINGEIKVIETRRI